MRIGFVKSIEQVFYRLINISGKQYISATAKIKFTVINQNIGFFINADFYIE